MSCRIKPWKEQSKKLLKVIKMTNKKLVNLLVDGKLSQAGDRIAVEALSSANGEIEVDEYIRKEIAKSLSRKLFALDYLTTLDEKQICEAKDHGYFENTEIAMYCMSKEFFKRKED